MERTRPSTTDNLVMNWRTGLTDPTPKQQIEMLLTQAAQNLKEVLDRPDMKEYLTEDAQVVLGKADLNVSLVSIQVQYRN